MEGWQIYLEEFRRRAQGAERQGFGRAEALAEAAHEAYRATADQLTERDGWTADHALMLTRGFNQAVKEWIGLERHDWGDLEYRLRRTQEQRTRSRAD